MIQIVRQVDVREEDRGKFELAYGPGGAWGSLFARAPGYRGTALLRDTKNHLKYLTIDAWDSEELHRGFLDQHREEYAALHAGLRDLVDSETEVGAYKLLAEATVRPSPGSGGRRTGPPRRGR